MHLALSLTICLAACEAGGEADRASDLDRRTTSAPLAIANLSSQISSAQLRVERLPLDIAARENLVELLLARTQFLGSYQDFDYAFDVVHAALELRVSPARTALLHAQLLSSVHEFDLAIDELDRADALGQATTELRETIALARGADVEDVLTKRSEVASLYPSYGAFTKLASALSSAGRYDEADAAYYQGLESYRDVSPFPLAWIAFQRGVLWGERVGDTELAKSLYQVAVRRLPQYVVGNVHLSELEFADGQVEEAIARLEAIVEETDDPEPASRLAQYLAQTRPELAASYAERARSSYEELLKRYPLAFADHACEFYLGAGNDPQRALDLALINLQNRQTPRAYDLVAQARDFASESGL